MSNINKIRENQQKIKNLHSQLSQLESQNQDKTSDVLFETCYDEEYIGANEFSSLIAKFIEVNSGKLSETEKEKLHSASLTFKSISEKEETQHQIVVQASANKREEIKALQDEIVNIIQTDFGFDKDYIHSIAVPVKHIQEFKGIVVDFLEKNKINFVYSRSGKIVFLDINSPETDVRENIQNEIRKVNPDFNFKSFASKGFAHVASHEVIDLLY